ncbi:M1-specific T cell receptor beta chain-like isoform X2 [Megalops cyprinoides]|uniref:M1-specific T cell receptor beta chain-like isoform X2 n=1 Tax=Megalops cyprinoides TaxID=118141 RepID=UPI001864734F|nr:M1-specific T cell receptor beta chain-like isoform X2 [Megalops cyprinoides]
MTRYCVPRLWTLSYPPCFFALFVIGGVVLQHPPSLRAAEGTNVTLHCDISDVTGQCISVWWLLVQPMGRLTHYDTINKTSTIPGNSETADQDCPLHIHSVSQSDMGTYYCAIRDSRMVYYGNGTTVIVTDLPTKDITMWIMGPVLHPPDPSAPVSLMCLVLGVDPSQCKVYWEVEGKVESPWLPEDKVLVSDSVKTQLSMPGQSWAEGTPVTCVLETASGLHLNRTISSTGKGTHSFCIYLTVAVAGMFSLIFILTVITVCVSWQGYSNRMRTYHPGDHTGAKQLSQGLGGVQYASLRFADGRRGAVSRL